MAAGHPLSPLILHQRRLCCWQNCLAMNLRSCATPIWMKPNWKKLSRKGGQTTKCCFTTTIFTKIVKLQSKKCWKSMTLKQKWLPALTTMKQTLTGQMWLWQPVVMVLFFLEQVELWTLQRHWLASIVTQLAQKGTSACQKNIPTMSVMQ